MPYLKLYIHFVWSTKNRRPFLVSEEIREAMWLHIKENADKKGIYVMNVNGYKDHCHCLISLGSNQTVEKIMQLVKGESSYWMNQQHLISSKFEWQDEYYAVTVSNDDIKKVNNCIDKQEQHHRKHSFDEEYDVFLNDSGLNRSPDGHVGKLN